MSGALHRLSAVCQRHGFAIFRVALGRIFPAMRPPEKIIVYSQALPSAMRVTREYEFRRIQGVSDPLSSALQREFGCPVEQRMADGSQECYVALAGESVVGYAWTTLDRFFIEEINHLYVMREDEVFIYDCFVREDFRGRGIYPAMLATVMQDQTLRLPGLKRALIGVSALNRSSTRGIIKAGFVPYSNIIQGTC